MAERPHPVDVVSTDLVNLYALGARRLEALIRPALARGLNAARVGTPAQKRGDATLLYRQRQLAVAREVLAELRRNGAAAAPVIARRAYVSALLAVDAVVDPDGELPGTVQGRFGGIHQAQVQIIAGNLARSLDRAAAAAEANVEAVFARAAALDGPLPAGGLPGIPRFIGRRVDDPWRRVALETIGTGRVALLTHRQITAELANRLVREGVTDALTGFVDSSGRRWSLDSYAAMVVRTTTREAATRATMLRLDEHDDPANGVDLDLVSVTSHPHKADECTPYDGKTFSRTGRTPGYPRLTHAPPFHPRCRHVLAPGSNREGDSILDRFERELGIKAREQAGPAPTPAVDKPARVTPIDRLRNTIANERAGALERVIDEETGMTADGRAKLRARVAAGDKVPDWRLAILEHEDKLRAQAAAGEIDPLDEKAVTAIGKAVRRLADRRNPLEKKATKALRQAERDEAAFFADWRSRATRDSDVDESYRHGKRRQELGEALEAARREDLLNVLRAIRPGYGTGEHDARVDVWSSERPDLDTATGLLPAEWVQASNRLITDLGGTFKIVRDDGRAFYRGAGVNGELHVRTGATSTMLHELGHRMEHSMPLLRRLQSQFYRRRTISRGKQEKLRPIGEILGKGSGYAENEVAREDKFAHVYVGKDYGGQWHEVLSMGLEGLFFDQHRIREKDQDHIAFILGLLAAA